VRADHDRVACREAERARDGARNDGIDPGDADGAEPADPKGLQLPPGDLDQAARGQLGLPAHGVGDGDRPIGDALPQRAARRCGPGGEAAEGRRVHPEHRGHCPVHPYPCGLHGLGRAHPAQPPDLRNDSGWQRVMGNDQHICWQQLTRRRRHRRRARLAGCSPAPRAEGDRRSRLRRYRLRRGRGSYPGLGCLAR
jgi:hypothetical protein